MGGRMEGRREAGGGPLGRVHSQSPMPSESFTTTVTTTTTHPRQPAQDGPPKMACHPSKDPHGPPKTAPTGPHGLPPL